MNGSIVNFRKRNLGGVSVVGILLLVAGGASAQVQRFDNGLTFAFARVPATEQVAVALAIPVGWRHDPVGRTGFAEVMRWWITLAQRAEVRGHQFTVSVHPDHTMISHTGPVRFLKQRVEFLRRLLAGELIADADLRALVLGRARLQADDHAWLLPGSVIRQKAWRTLAKGEALGRQNLGIPAEMASISGAELQARLLQAYGATGASLAVFGNLDAAAVQAAVAPLRAIPRSKQPPLSPMGHDSAPPMKMADTHERVDGPFVSVAFPSVRPDAADFVPFVVGVAALRILVHFHFGAARGNEWRAAFPYVAYRYWEDDRVVLINRRGPDIGDPAIPKEEIRDLLVRLRKFGVGQQRFESARREIGNVLAGPGARNTTGPLMSQRARHLAMATCRGWPTDLRSRLESVTLEDVDRVLRSTLAEERLAWFTLSPTAATVERISRLRMLRGSRGNSVQPREAKSRRMP